MVKSYILDSNYFIYIIYIDHNLNAENYNIYTGLWHIKTNHNSSGAAT